MLLTEARCDEKEYFQCKNLYQCINRTKVHDGEEDCLDRTDESELSVVTC